MKAFTRKVTILVAICMLNLLASAQVPYTQYDDLPGIYKSCKPSYDDNFPLWAKMLYQYPVNFNVINREFDQYMLQHSGEKSAVIRYFKIWQRAIGSNVLPDGTFELPDLGLYYENMRKSRLDEPRNKLSNPVTGADWTFLGPKETFWLNESGSATVPSSCPWQVNVYSFDVATSDNNILYCGTETGYVNKSINKGVTWQLVGQNYPFGGGVTAVAVHPSNPDIVYVAAGNQVHRTTDGGITWSPLLPSGNLFNADRMKIDPVNPQKILAASSNGVYVSTDGGGTWSKKWSKVAIATLGVRIS